jgi:protein arginine kinase activator
MFIKQVVNHQVTEIKLCEECARHNDVAAPLLESAPFQEFIESLLTAFLPASASVIPDDGEDIDAECPRCGMTYDMLRATGRVGCADCYETFSLTLDEVIQQVHHSADHAGKVPTPASPEPILGELESLRQALSAAVAAERYEEAANLRDRIWRLIGKKES